MKAVALLAVALLLALAAPARADFSVSAFSAAPPSTDAGAHSNFTASFSFGGSEDVRDLDLTLPRGLKFDKKLLRKGAKVTAGSKKVSGLRVLSSRTLSIPKVPGTSVASLRIALSKGFVRADKSLRKKARKKPRLKFSFSATDAQSVKFTLQKTVVGR